MKNALRCFLFMWRMQIACSVNLERSVLSEAFFLFFSFFYPESVSAAADAWAPSHTYFLHISKEGTLWQTQNADSAEMGVI